MSLVHESLDVAASPAHFMNQTAVQGSHDGLDGAE